MIELVPRDGCAAAVEVSVAERLLPPGTPLLAGESQAPLRIDVSAPALQALLAADAGHSAAGQRSSAIDGEVAAWLHRVNREADPRFHAACRALLGCSVYGKGMQTSSNLRAHEHAFAAMGSDAQRAAVLSCDPAARIQRSLDAALARAPIWAHGAVCSAAFCAAAGADQQPLVAIDSTRALNTLAREMPHGELGLVLRGPWMDKHEFAALASLTGVTCLEARLQPGNTKPFAKALAKLTGLRNLNVAHSALAFAVAGENAATLADSVAQLTCLARLDMSDCGIGWPGFRRSPGRRGDPALAQALTALPSLAHLNIRSNSIGPDGAAALASPLAALSALTHLDISSNDINRQGAAALAQALTALPSLAHLDIRSNHIGPRGAAALASPLTALSALSHLDVSSNELGNAGGAELAGALCELTRLVHLSAHNNKITDAESTCILGVTQLTQLTHLDFGGNGVGNAHATSLIGALSAFRNLEHLDVTACSIGDAGAVALADAFASLQRLRTLHISYNGISDAGVKALARTLPRLSDLSVLFANGDDYGCEGAAALMHAASALTALTRMAVTRPGQRAWSVTN